jgi:hypothetical protein
MPHDDSIALIGCARDASQDHLLGTSTFVQGASSAGGQIATDRQLHDAPAWKTGRPSISLRCGWDLVCPQAPAPGYPGSFKAILNRLHADGWRAQRLRRFHRNGLAIQPRVVVSVVGLLAKGCYSDDRDDLSMGSVIRQHRATDYAGNFLRKPAAKRSPPTGQAPTTASQPLMMWSLMNSQTWEISLSTTQ